tara:strand:+ start:312 stop:539 length:228 start_codon:yes stop_codon:yes gene_type:complete
MGGEDNDTFIDMKEMKQGWIQEQLEGVFELVVDVEIFERLDHPNTELELIEIGLEETRRLLKRLKDYRKFLIKHT